MKLKYIHVFKYVGLKFHSCNKHPIPWFELFLSEESQTQMSTEPTRLWHKCAKWAYGISNELESLYSRHNSFHGSLGAHFLGVSNFSRKVLDFNVQSLNNYLQATYSVFKNTCVMKRKNISWPNLGYWWP